MSSVLIVFGGEAPDAPVTVCTVEGRSGAPQPNAPQFGDIGMCGGQDIILVLPGYVITALEAPIAARSERQALAAAPFAVEDDLASDPDSLHFALAPQARGDQTGLRTVLAMDKDLLGAWIGAASAAGARLKAVLPDYWCLPSVDDSITALGTEDRLVLRDGDWGVSVDGDMAEAVVPAVIEGRPNGREVSLVAGFHHDVPSLSAGLQGQSTENLYAVMAQGAVKAGPGMLQGGFAVRNRTAGDGASLIGALKWPSVLAAAATLVVSAVNVTNGLMLQARTEAVREETREAFLQAFPETQRITNVRAQLRQVSQGGPEGRPDFLVLSGHMAAGLDAVDAVSIDSLRFDASTNEINASVVFDSYDALSRFRTAVESAGGRVVEGGSRQVGDRRAGDVKVSLP
ncbi:MAG: type II secretion system protein GspL [Pseudomonadota bacterium]